jgi:transcriptional regulator with GAF, ATPase, and Fis domain
VTVNCAAIPRELVESEMFGHERGAFTGAHERRLGRFELADGGTLFLDEVGDLNLEAQAKLLRTLETGVLQRLGAEQPTAVDVRVVSATNRKLDRSEAGASFREDLYFRLNIFPIHLPPLRERLDDLPALVAHLADAFGPGSHKHSPRWRSRRCGAIAGRGTSGNSPTWWSGSRFWVAKWWTSML